jgi:hypothetical protein
VFHCSLNRNGTNQSNRTTERQRGNAMMFAMMMMMMMIIISLKEYICLLVMFGIIVINILLLRDEELWDLYSFPSIIRMMKSRMMGWTGHVARMGRKGTRIGYIGKETTKEIKT